MTRLRLTSVSMLLLVACAAATETTPGEDPTPTPGLTKDEARAMGGTADGGADLCERYGWYGDGICDGFCAQPDPDCGVMATAGPLEVEFLGVGGFLLRHGDDAVLTAPMFSNPNLFATLAGEARPDVELIERLTADTRLDDVRAIVVGHAHYDHLMDVPPIWPRTDEAQIFGNRTMKHILAAWAPDRADRCEGTPAQDVSIPRERVVQLNDPLGVLGRDLVDYRMCPGLGDGEGDWVYVDGANVRVRALCSSHPDQFAFFHFGEGSLGADLCEPPRRAESWVEGATLSYLIDFLDPETGEPVHRVYYQDAPNDGQHGYVPPELLEDKAVDLALICVGNFNQVDDHPGAVLRHMQPRYTIGGHWEDFFRTQEQEIVPLPFHDVEEYQRRAGEAVTSDGRVVPPVMVDGAPEMVRQWLPLPGTTFDFQPEPPAAAP